MYKVPCICKVRLLEKYATKDNHSSLLPTIGCHGLLRSQVRVTQNKWAAAIRILQ